MPSIVVGERAYACAGTLTIGRAPTCDIVLAWSGRAAHYVARVHAHVTIDDTGSAIFRELSDDGSHVNGAWLCGCSVPLQDGDRIRIGEHELVFVL